MRWRRGGWVACAISVLACAGVERRDAPGKPAPSGAAATATAPASRDATLEHPRSTTISVSCGFLWVENHGPTTFTVLLGGPGVRQLPPNTSGVYLADDVIFEATSASASDIGAPAARGEELLRRHMQWESSYTARRKGWPAVNAGGSAVKPLGDAAATMVWGYDFPEPSVVFDRKITRVLYTTSAVDDVVFALATPLEKDERRDSHVIEVLERVMRTLARESRPLDVFALSAELKAGGRWKGCPAAAAQKDAGATARLRFSQLELHALDDASMRGETRDLLRSLRIAP